MTQYQVVTAKIIAKHIHFINIFIFLKAGIISSIEKTKIMIVFL